MQVVNVFVHVSGVCACDVLMASVSECVMRACVFNNKFIFVSTSLFECLSNIVLSNWLHMRGACTLLLKFTWCS